ncbi:MAG: diguanylate cyclase [Elusimicrobia bacterium]|nr:diguanylate cyclase [Elusimicrobiota bacterium]
MERRARKLLSVLLSGQLVFWSVLPQQVLAAPPSAESQLVTARRDLQTSFATLQVQTPFPGDELAKTFSGLASGSAVEAAWKSLARAGARYEVFRSRLSAYSQEELSAEVQGLAKDLGLSEKDGRDLVPRYVWLRSRMAEAGVTFKDGLFLDKDGLPFSPESWDAFTGRGAALTPELAAEIAAKNQALLEIQELAKKGDHKAAAARLGALLEGIADRPDLLEKGFGSTGVETTLALINETNKLLDKGGRTQVQAQMGRVDAQLKQVLVANRKTLNVPSLGSQGEGPGLGPTPFGTQLALSFYAALSQFPGTSGWAKARFYAESTGESLRMLKARGDVKSYRLTEVDPLGGAGLGYEVVFKDGSSRYEGYGGLTVATSKDRRVVTVDDKAKGALRRLLDGSETAAWAKDPKTGEVRGHFRNMHFTAAKGQTLMFSDDGETLFFADGVDDEGKPRIVRWIKPAGKERGMLLPGGLGQVITHLDNGRFRKDILLDPGILRKLMSGKGIDLSAIPETDLDPVLRDSFERILRELPNLQSLAANAWAGSAGMGVEALYIRDDRLYVSLTQGGNPRDTYTAERAMDGRTPYIKMFLFSGPTTIMRHCDVGLTACEEYLPDDEIQKSENRVAFRFSSRWEKQGSKWAETNRVSPEVRERTWVDDVADVGASMLGGLGKGVEVVFSPFQTLLYDILGLFHLATGAAIKLFDEHSDFASFEQISAFYTLCQAKFNSWAIQGLAPDGADPVLMQYRAALRDYFSSPGQRKLLEAFLDDEVDKVRRKRYGELYRFRSEDPITEGDRAYMAAGIFGYANLAAQYFAEGRESWEKGGWRGKLSALPSYAAGGFVIAGEAYVEGLGFGLAAAPLKLGAAGARAGLSSEQVALAMQASKGGKNLATLSKAEQQAVKFLKAVNRAELTAFLAPAGIQTGTSAVQWVDAAFISKDPEAAWAHFDALFSGAAGFGAMGIGLLQARVTQFAKRASDARLAASRPEPQAKPSSPLLQGFVMESQGKGATNATNLVESILSTDARSGMPNRAHLEKNGPGVLSKAKQPAVAIMDMNNLGAIQDGLIKALESPVQGKLMTDAIIGKTGAIINSLAAEHGVTVSRLSAGGEEFAVLGEKADVAKFLERVQVEFAGGRVLRDAGIRPDNPALGAKYKKVMQAIDDTVIAKRGERQPFGDFTFGLAEMVKGRDMHATLQAADIALTKAKDAGLRGGGLVERPGSGFEAFTPSGEVKAGPLTPVEVEPLTRSLSLLKGMMTPVEFQGFLKDFAKDFTGARTHEYLSVLELQGAGAKGGDVAVTSSRDFKVLNDAAGHEAGDAFLAAKGKALAETVAQARSRGLDVSPEVLRIGGKEFALLGKDAGRVMAEFSKSWDAALAEGRVISPADRAKILAYSKAHPEVTDAVVSGLGRQRTVTRKFQPGESLRGAVETALGDLEILKAAEKPKAVGKLTGEPAKIGPKEDPEVVRSLNRQNETAQTLYKNGYVVDQRGTAEGADFSVNGAELDCYAPKTDKPRAIWHVVKVKVLVKKQGRGVVLDLDDSAVSLEALRSQFERFPVEGLKDILVVRGGQVVPLMKGGRVLAPGEPLPKLSGKPFLADAPEAVTSAEAKVSLETSWKSAEARLAEIEGLRSGKGLKPLTEAQRSDILLTRLYRELNPEKGAVGRSRGRGGIVLLDGEAGLKGVDLATAKRLGLVLGRRAPSLESSAAESAGVRLLDLVDEVMLDPGATEAKIQFLRQRFGKYAAESLGDGAWPAWIIENVSLVARDPALRSRLRGAVQSGDAGLLGKAGEAFGTDPALSEGIELQQAVFDVYDAALKRQGISGTDRFDTKSAEVQKALLAEVMGEMTRVVKDPKARASRAEHFRQALGSAAEKVSAAAVDLAAARAALPKQGAPASGLDAVFAFDAGRIPAEVGVFALSGGVAADRGRSLVVGFEPMPAGPGGESRTGVFLAAPDPKAAGSLKAVGEAINKANREKSHVHGMHAEEAGFVAGQDSVQVAARPGLLLTPAEILAVVGAARSRQPKH